MEFSDCEIRKELLKYGFRDISNNVLDDFKRQLDRYIRSENNNHSSLGVVNIDQTSKHLKAKTDERVQHSKSGNIELKTLDDSKSSKSAIIYKEPEACFESILYREKILDEDVFRDDEISDVLSKLGYRNVPQHTLSELKKILNFPIHCRTNSKSLSQNIISNNSVETETLKKQVSIQHSQNNNGIHAYSEGRSNQNVHSEQLYVPVQTEDMYQSNSNNDFNNSFAYPSVGLPNEHNCNRATNSSFLLNTQSHQVPQRNSERAKTGVNKSSCRSFFSEFKRTGESITKNEVSGGYNFYENSQRNRDYRNDEPLAMFSKSSKKFGLPRKPSWLKKPKQRPNEDRPKQPDAFELMKYYHKEWAVNKCPGENAWAADVDIVRERGRKKFELKKSQKIYVANSYLRPHEKTRQEIRDSVKQSLAAYKLPKHGLYHDVAPLE